MSSTGRYNHPVSINQEQEEIVNKAKNTPRKNKLPSYADLMVLGALAWIKQSLSEVRK